MGRLGENIRGVLKAVLVCGMSIQILLGAAWFIKNIGGMQTFQESVELLRGGGTGAGLYSGVLYRGLVCLLSSHLWILYGMQLAAAFSAGYGLMVCFTGKNEQLLRLLGALTLLTIPQALQCHLAVLPWSLGTSLLVGETALWRRICTGNSAPDDKSGKAGRTEVCLTFGMLAGWLLLILILPVYACFVLPLFIAALWHVGRAKAGAERLICVLAALAVIFSSVTVNWGFDPAQWNRRLAAGALSRVGWPYFQEIYDDIPEPLHDDIGLVTAREISAYADGVERTLIPKLEQLYGPKKSTAALWELAGICLKANLRTDVKNVVWDLAAYHATPPVLAMQLQGRAYDAYSGINYQQMKNRAPLLTRVFVTYGSRWWWIMLILAAVIWVGNRPRGRRRIFLRCSLPVLIGAEWMIWSCVLGGSGVMDYKKTLWVIILWYMAALSALVVKREK